MINTDWKDPAVNPANNPLDFRRADVVYYAEMNGTVIDVDVDVRYLKAQCLKKNRGDITYYAVNQISGRKVRINPK